jgi:D-glycero-beta-D-manno-heptose 1-phosphate adenylyltransferase
MGPGMPERERTPGACCHDLSSRPVNTSSKLLTRAVLLERFGPGRASGIVVFTNGCFDLLHPGHVDYLEKARSLGDALVVGVNTDSSVARLKGPSRPFVGEEDRARVLSALACVDAVTLFGEDTPLQLISALLPSVLVKGGDYSVDEVVGREVVEAAGGTVTIIPFLSGYSTTELLERIQVNRGEKS